MRRGALRAFIASSGRRSAATVDRLFFFECTSAHIFTFSTPLRVTSVPPSAPWRSVLYYRTVISLLSSRSLTQSTAGCESEYRGLRNEGQRVCDRDCRRETGGTRPAAIPRYTNLLGETRETCARLLEFQDGAYIRIAD